MSPPDAAGPRSGARGSPSVRGLRQTRCNRVVKQMLIGDRLRGSSLKSHSQRHPFAMHVPPGRIGAFSALQAPFSTDQVPVGPPPAVTLCYKLVSLVPDTDRIEVQPASSVTPDYPLVRFVPGTAFHSATSRSWPQSNQLSADDPSRHDAHLSFVRIVSGCDPSPKKQTDKHLSASNH